jgi:hypothetical protein
MIKDNNERHRISALRAKPDAQNVILQIEKSMDANQSSDILLERNLRMSQGSAKFLKEQLRQGGSFKAKLAVARVGDKLLVGIGHAVRETHLDIVNRASQELLGRDVAVLEWEPRSHGKPIDGVTIEGVTFAFNSATQKFTFEGNSRDFGGFQVTSAYDVIERFVKSTIRDLMSDL